MAKKEIVDNLGEFYMVFVNVIEFKEAALVCLNDCTSLVKMTVLFVSTKREKKKTQMYVDGSPNSTSTSWSNSCASSRPTSVSTT